MNQITFCIPTKNNLRYLKSSIASIKENSSMSHDIIVYIDSDNDGTEEWLKTQTNVAYLKNHDDEPKGIAHGYNMCIDAAETDIVCMFHADMYMAKVFDVAICKYIKEGVVVSGTRIEPPLHPEGKEKIVKNFGMYPEDFMKAEFDEFTAEYIQNHKDKTTVGIFAPWAIYKRDVEAINLHDEMFHSYHEDSDIFNRFLLAGYELVQTWEGLVYHLTCRGGRFQDGIDKVTADPAFHRMKETAARDYLRKWGSWIINDEYQKPIIPRKYNVAFVVKNCTYQLLEALEPCCDRIYVENKFNYRETEQPNTSFDLDKRVLYISENDPEAENDIVLKFDGTQFTQDSFNIIQNLSDIITESGEVGTFNLDCFTVIISSMETYEKNLITELLTQ